MTKPKAIEILTQYAKWRKDLSNEMISPYAVSNAIDSAIKHLKESVRAGKLKKARAMKAKEKAKA